MMKFTFSFQKVGQKICFLCLLAIVVSITASAQPLQKKMTLKSSTAIEMSDSDNQKSFDKKQVKTNEGTNNSMIYLENSDILLFDKYILHQHP